MTAPDARPPSDAERALGCLTCNGWNPVSCVRRRETKGLVCQSCGWDYANGEPRPPSDETPATVGCCHDCGLPYGEPGWCDAHIPTDIWVRISPTGGEGGLLCITCMARRLVEAGIDNVPLLVGSGPWDFDTATERIRLEALTQGREQGRPSDQGKWYSNLHWEGRW